MLVSPYNFFQAVNYSKGRSGTYVDHIVLHCTRTTGMTRTIDICQDLKELRSYHFIIGRDGRVVQTVRIRDTAWHARSISNLEHANERSVAITLIGLGNVFTDNQYTSLVNLSKTLIKIFPIEESGIIGYDSISDDTIYSPGPNFYWKSFLDRLFPYSTHEQASVALDKDSRLFTIKAVRNSLDKNIFGPGK